MFGRRFWEAGNFAQGSSGEDALGLIFAFTRLDWPRVLTAGALLQVGT